MFQVKDEDSIKVKDIAPLWEFSMYQTMEAGEDPEYIHMMIGSTGSYYLYSDGIEYSPSYVNAFSDLIGRGVVVPAGFGNPNGVNMLVFQPNADYFKFTKNKQI
jgi:hypothetical protein